MKIREAIETVDRLLSNQYETPDKVQWLSELDRVSGYHLYARA